jgi:hypothetical protein
MATDTSEVFMGSFREMEKALSQMETSMHNENKYHETRGHYIPAPPI